jgi:hypothetical protein
VKNVFHIDADDPRHAGRLNALLGDYSKLRASLNESFPLQCEQGVHLEDAWVDLNDPTGTMHFPPNYFIASSLVRTEKIIHERSHTVLGAHHDGMAPGGAVKFGQSPDDNNGFTYEQAVRNAYCYGWLATALQPNYVPEGDPDVITGTPRRK